MEQAFRITFNSKRTIFSALLLIVGIGSLFSQQRILKLSTGSVDFGKIAANAIPPKTIEFENTSSEKLAILLIEKSSDVKVQYANRFYQPGEKGIISLHYEPRNTGNFEESISIHTNLDNSSYPIMLTGTVVSILECFPDPKNLLKRSIQVIDKTTKVPIPNAELVLVHNHKYNKPFTLKVDDEGKAIAELPIGLYNITAEASAYEKLIEERFIPKSQPIIILELSALKQAPQVPSHPQPVTQIDKPPKVISGPIVTSTDLPENKYAANNLIFLLDVSTSMKASRKFLLMQQSVNNLAMILRSIDNVSIISYSSEALVILTGIDGSEKELILGTVQELRPYGITRGVKGINKAYELAEQNFIQAGNNQIILMTDGEFSEKGLSDTYYQEMLSGYAAKGISLSIIGFGINKEAIDRMQFMSEAGQGSFILVKSDDFVKEVLIEEVKAKSFMGN